MIGDHHQLPPVIKNMAFQKYSNMEQSLFTRFVRLGVPTVDLDAQGRARPRYVGHPYGWGRVLGSSPGRVTCVLKQDTSPLFLCPLKTALDSSSDVSVQQCPEFEYGL